MRTDALSAWDHKKGKAKLKDKVENREKKKKVESD